MKTLHQTGLWELCNTKTGFIISGTESLHVDEATEIAIHPSVDEEVQQYIITGNGGH